MENALRPRQVLGFWRATAVGLTALAASAWLAPATAVMPDAPRLLSHAAGYTIAVKPEGNSGLISGGRGVMQLEWQRDCDGVSFSQHSILSLYQPDGEVVDTELRVASWEAADASTYRFTLDSIVAGERFEEVSGLARRGRDGSVTVRYTAPEEREVVLSADTIFPWQQIRLMFQQAAAKRFHEWQLLLRGESEADPVRVGIHYMGEAGPPADLGVTDALLLPVQGWRYATAYFEDPDAAGPAFETTETMLSSGVIPNAAVTYPDMSMRLTLTTLKALPTPECRG